MATLWVIRSKYDHFDPLEAYVNEPTMFTLKINHGGVFSKSPRRKYINGTESYVDYIDADKFSMHEYIYMMEDLGYKDEDGIPMYYHFLLPELDLDYGLHALGSDQDVLVLCNYVNVHKVINVYTKYGKTNLKTYLKSPKTSKVRIEVLPDENLHEPPKKKKFPKTSKVRIEELLESIKHEAAQYSVEWNGGQKFQVTGPWMDQCVVDMSAKECSCRKWELSGLPCKHVVATIWNMALNGGQVGLPESWAHPCYFLETWKKVYSYKVDPINGCQLWAKSECPTTLTPPIHHTQVGRPKKKRKKSAEELSQPLVNDIRLSRQGKIVACAKCHNLGHNSRSCKSQQMHSGSERQGPKSREQTCSVCKGKGHNSRSCTKQKDGAAEAKGKRKKDQGLGNV